MVNLQIKDAILNEFKENVAANRAANCGDVDITKFMLQGNADLVKDCLVKVKDNVLAAVPAGVEVPRISLYHRSQMGAEGISLVLVTVTNVISSNKKFKFALSLSNRNATEVAFDFFTDVYEKLMIDVMIEDNLEKVNDILDRAAKEAGLDYAIKVVTPMGNEGKKIAFMSDQEIQFVADEERALNLDDILVLRDPEGLITEEMISDAFKVETESIAEAQTPEQLVAKQGGLLVQYVCDISKLTKPMTLIKKISNKNVKNTRGEKDCIMYYNQDKVFALVAKRDGNLEVILSPFETDTMRKVDVDVLAAQV